MKVSVLLRHLSRWCQFDVSSSCPALVLPCLASHRSAFPWLSLPAAGALGAQGPPESTAHQAAEAEVLHWAVKALSPLWHSLTLTPFQD